MRFFKKNFRDITGDTKKIGNIVKTTDGDILYAVDLEDTSFLRWLYEYKDNKYIKKDNEGVDLLLWELEQSVGLFPDTLTKNNNVYDQDAIMKLKLKIKQLLEE